MRIGTSIKQLRKQLKISQQELSEKTGLSQTSISQIELNKKMPHKNNLEAIAAALGTTPEIIYANAIDPKDFPKEKGGTIENIKKLIYSLIS